MWRKVNYHFSCYVTLYFWMKITIKKSLKAMSSVQCNTNKTQYVHWTIRMALIVIKRSEKKKKHPSWLHRMYSSTVCPAVDSGLAKSSKHSTTEWVYSLWSHSTPISLCYKLCFHTVSVDHLLVQHCLLKMKMTEHGGGLGGCLSGVVLVCLVCVWLERRDTVHVHQF